MHLNMVALIIWSVLLSLAWNTTPVLGQFDDNTPPVMHLERNWTIPDNAVVDSIISTVHGSDSDDDQLTYFLEPVDPKTHLPFRIDNTTGIVYLNESIKQRSGETFLLYVCVTDGKFTAKTEVYVHIQNMAAIKRSNANLQPFGGGSNRGILPPSFLSISQYNPPREIANNPPPRLIPPIFQQKENVYKATTPTRIHLLPVPVEKADNRDPPRNAPTESNEETASLKPKVPVDDKPVESVPDVTATVVPIASVCAVIVVVGVVTVLFRKKLCHGRSKENKEDIRKESSENAAVRENPALALQQWRGPRAFSNRYESWDPEQVHSQVSGENPVLLKASDKWEFPRHKLKFFNILGEGAFGQVWKCEAVDIDGNEGVHVVAVKTLKENATEKERSDLVSELQVMKMLEPHPNVVRLLGCCAEKDPIFLIMEFVSKGKLQSYLRNSRAERYYNNMHGQSKSLTSRDLTSFVYQVARGMEFLSSNGIIHRDLAARNVLISENHTCKVADFGFARDVIASYVYERKSEGRLPIRWMAPESLYDNVFSVKSDVWSFGVLIWEIVTLGSTPYPGLSAAEVMRRVRDGHRLDKPEHCRRELYNIMYYCWDKDPKQRPSFTECVQLLEKLLMTETDYIELERFPDHSYYNMMNISGEKL